MIRARNYYILSVAVLLSPAYGDTWEMGLRIEEGGNPVEKRVRLYHIDNVLSPYREGRTFQHWNGSVNGFCDFIGSENTNDPIDSVIWDAIEIDASYYIWVEGYYAELYIPFVDVGGVSHDFIIRFSNSEFSIYGTPQIDVVLGPTYLWPWIILDQKLTVGNVSTGIVETWSVNF
jgi:hypothetical protein